MVPYLAPKPLLRVDIPRHGSVSALGDAAAAACVAIGQVRPVLRDVEGAAIGAYNALAKRVRHGYASSGSSFCWWTCAPALRGVEEHAGRDTSTALPPLGGRIEPQSAWARARWESYGL